MKDVDFAALGPVLPILTIEDAADAIPLAEALRAGGVRALEITLRTPAALEAARALAQIEGLTIGVGTVLTAADVEDAVEAGARFLVSPGFSEAIVAAAKTLRTPILPGVSTGTEIMRALDAGVTTLKFFPAETAGGAGAVAAFAGPFPHAKFCPTGGIGAAHVPAYLALPNVICVGGSWLAPKSLVAAKDWSAITRLAEAAAALR